MHLMYGWSKTPLLLSGQCRYTPESIFERIQTKRRPYWVSVEGECVLVSESTEGLWVAVQLTVAYHNSLVHPDDGFNERIQASEARVQAHLDDPDESSEEDVVHSEDDMVYEREAYV